MHIYAKNKSVLGSCRCKRGFANYLFNDNIYTAKNIGDYFYDISEKLYYIPLLLIQSLICASDEYEFPRNPSFTVLFGQISLIADTDDAIPLPPLVQNGIIVLPDKS